MKMNTTQIRTITLGELVAENPLVIPVLNRYRLDYCCGGKDALSQVLKQEGLDEELVYTELEEAMSGKEASAESYRDWREASIPEIVDRILQTHHVFMKESLAELNILMFRVLKAHYSHHPDLLLSVHQLFGTLKTELEAHLVKEEESLFPRILEFAASGSRSVQEEVLAEMSACEQEHDGAGDLFKQLHEVTDGYRAPSDGCMSFWRTYDLLDALEKDTFNHIHLENTILFEKIRNSR